MDLKEFIKEVLSDITDAVSESQTELKNGTIISPSMPVSISTKTIKTDGGIRLISDIDFDLSVVADESKNLGGGMSGSVKVLSFKLDAGKGEKCETVSRVRFTIPVVLPSIQVESDSEFEARKRKGSMPSLR